MVLQIWLLFIMTRKGGSKKGGNSKGWGVIILKTLNCYQAYCDLIYFIYFLQMSKCMIFFICQYVKKSGMTYHHSILKTFDCWIELHITPIELFDK